MAENRAPARAQIVVDVFRIAAGSSTYVRTLSPAVGLSVDGLLTHHVRERSEYCAGNQCDPALHRVKSQWKGYFAAEVWQDDARFWRPVAFEVTEALELDFRRRYQRGQLWQVERGKKLKKNAQPAVRAKFIETLEPSDLRPAFNFLPVLCVLYHANVTLGVKSPVPDRVVLDVSDSAPPSPIAAAETVAEPMTAEKWRELTRATGYVPPSERKNGQANGKH
jgi:hypothetical protein